MPYCQLYYHFVWTTKLRRPLLTPKIEPIIYNYLRTKAIELGGLVFALNGKEPMTTNPKRPFTKMLYNI